MIGTLLDNRYEVLQKVGEGGMATVYRGRHATLNRDVAVKVLHPHLSSSTRNRKRFAREARAIERLRHDNILEIFDYSGLDANDCYIITEFVEGRTVSSLLHDRGRLPSEVAALIGMSLGTALAYAHAQGILHRDIKPDNVMIRHDGLVKLMDFGIAHFLYESHVTMTGAIVGSPAFMSPEQAKEDAQLDQRSDLFSLGTVLYYLVTGQLPFSGSNPSLILKNVIEGNRPEVSELAPAVSPRLADIIERLMSPSPEDRFDSADQVVEALRGALDEVRLSPCPPNLTLEAYLQDPVAYESRLEVHLRETLVAVGKQHLARGDHLGALRLFNRLLSIDEDNPEVLALVQGLHTKEQPSSRRLGLLALVFALALFGVGTLTVSSAWTELQQRGNPGPGPAPAPSALVSPQGAVPPTVATAVAPDVRPEPSPAVPAPEPAPPPAPTPVLATPPFRVPPIDAPNIKRATLPPPRPTSAPPPDGPGQVRFVSNYPADIYLSDHKIGSTRDSRPIELPAGSHQVEIRASHLLPQTVELTVSPGELLSVPVTLQPRPALVRFDDSWPGLCVVLVDGVRAGTLTELSRQVEVRRPASPHKVALDCEGARKEESYTFVPLDTRFPSRD